MALCGIRSDDDDAGHDVRIFTSPCWAQGMHFCEK